jgi:hypothetical protein
MFQDSRQFGISGYLWAASSLSSRLDFCNGPLKIQEQPFNLLIFHIWSIFFLL